MKSAGLWVSNHSLVLERVVHLGERHRAGVEPHVEDVGDAAHRRAPGRVVGVRPDEVVDVRAVQVGLALGIARQPPEVALELFERAVDVDARVLGVVALPHRDRRAPVAVAADRPVARARDPLAELAVLDVVGHPVDLLVELAHAVAELGHADEPARHRLVDERVAAAPAVRVRVLVARLAEQAPLGLAAAA